MVGMADTAQLTHQDSKLNMHAGGLKRGLCYLDELLKSELCRGVDNAVSDKTEPKLVAILDDFIRVTKDRSIEQHKRLLLVKQALLSTISRANDCHIEQIKLLKSDSISSEIQLLLSKNVIDSCLADQLSRINDTQPALFIEDYFETATEYRDLVEKSSVLELVEYLDFCLSELAIEFMVYAKKSPNPDDVLFINITDDESEIQQHYSKIVKEFYPARFPSVYERLCKDFLEILEKSRLKRLEMAKFSIQSLTVKALEFRNLSTGYAKFLDKNDGAMKHLSKREILKYSKRYAMLAFDQYKTACQKADKIKLFSSQMLLRQRLAECLLSAHMFYESQLVALSLLFLTKNSSPENKSLANSFLNRIQYQIKLFYNPNLPSLESQEFNRTTTLITIEPIHIIKPVLGTDSTVSSVEEERHELNLTTTYFSLHQLVTFVALFTCSFFMCKQLETNASLLNLTIILLCLSLGFTSLFSKLYSSSTSGKKKPTQYYHSKPTSQDYSDHTEIINEAMQSYYNDLNYNECLFKLSKIFNSCEASSLVDRLLDLEIAPHSIAGLLKLICESSHFCDETSNPSELQGKLLHEICENQRLASRAIQLDTQLNKTIIHAKTLKKKCLKPIKEPDSFGKRLVSIRHIAKFDLIILKCLNGNGPTRESLNDLKTYLSRLNPKRNVSDFERWVFNPDNSTLPYLCHVLNADSINYPYQVTNYEIFLDKLLAKSAGVNVAHKISFLNQKADFLFEKAEALLVGLEKFIHYKKAYILFLESFNLEKSNNLAGVGVLKCLVKLNRHKQALRHFTELLHKHYAFYSQLAEFWLYAGMASCARYLLHEARFYFTRADEIASTRLTRSQLEKVRNLAEKKVERPSFKDTVKYYVNMAENNSNLKNSSLSESKYRILAIDGGGVRGAIPSMLLAEVERRAHKPMSSMVNLFAGTSTGAMISACLAMPKHKGSTRPLYSAAETMSFYVNETPFRNPYNLAQMQYYKYKYEDGDRMRVLNGIFRGDGHDRRISEAVCELYIPAMNATATSLVHEFTRHSGKRFTAEDYSIVDVLMATSAAPIYFKPYTMPGSTGGGGQTFLDGGLLAVSPTRRAYEYAVAVHGVDPRSVCALSLGTGDFLDSSLDKERPKGLAYWLGNIAKTIISSTEYDVDLSMRNSLGRERYKRWQVYFERPIRIDEYAYMSYMIDLCEQFIEDNDEAINQVVDLFDTE